jgi:hypothetical protein
MSAPYTSGLLHLWSATRGTSASLRDMVLSGQAGSLAWPLLPRVALPYSLSSTWPQPAIWHLCPMGKELPASGRQMGWTNWERTAQRSPFFFSRIKTGQGRGQRSAWGVGPPWVKSQGDQ